MLYALITFPIFLALRLLTLPFYLGFRILCLPLYLFSFPFFAFLLGGAISAVLVYQHFQRHLARRNAAVAVDVLSNLTPQQFRKLLGDESLPSFFKFPDSERVEWLNEVFKQLWPFIDLAVADQVRLTVGPMLEEQKPPYLGKLELSQFSLGTKHPQITGVKTFPKDQSRVSDVSMDVDFLWSANCNVQLLVKPIPKHIAFVGALPFTFTVGVKDVVLTGRMRVKMKPLMDTVPVVGALSFSFVEVPKLNFSLRVFGGNLTAIPGLDVFLDSFVREQLMAYTLPERYLFPLITGDLGALERPCGILRVGVIECRALPSADIFSMSDPYVEVFVREKRKVRTEVVNGNNNPRYDQEFTFFIHDRDSQAVYFRVYDWDLWIAKDDLLGEAQVRMRDLPCGEEQDLWMRLAAPDERRKPPPGVITEETRQQKSVRAPRGVRKALTKHHSGAGFIHLRLTYLPLDSEALTKTAASAAVSDNGRGEGEGEEAQGVGKEEGRGSAPAGPGPVPVSPPAPPQGPTPPPVPAAPIGPPTPALTAIPLVPVVAPGGAAGGGGVPVVAAGQGAYAYGGGAPGQARGVEGGGQGQVQDGQGPPRGVDRDGEGGGGGTEPMEAGAAAAAASAGLPERKQDYKDIMRMGLLYVTIVSGVSLPTGGKLIFRPRWMVKVYVGSRGEPAAHKKSSRIVTGKDKSPIINEKLEFQILPEEVDDPEAILQLELWDVRLSDTQKGFIQVPLREVMDAGRIEHAFTLQGAKQGSLELKLEWLGVMQM